MLMFYHHNNSFTKEMLYTCIDSEWVLEHVLSALFLYKYIVDYY